MYLASLCLPAYQNAINLIINIISENYKPLSYRIAGNICRGKSWQKRKIRHIGGFKFGGFTIIHQPRPSFKLLTCVRMEGEADVAKFVLK